jgi:hypothetical protein
VRLRLLHCSSTQGSTQANPQCVSLPNIRSLSVFSIDRPIALVSSPRHLVHKLHWVANPPLLQQRTPAKKLFRKSCFIPARPAGLGSTQRVSHSLDTGGVRVRGVRVAHHRVSASERRWGLVHHRLVPWGTRGERCGGRQARWYRADTAHGPSDQPLYLGSIDSDGRAAR